MSVKENRVLEKLRQTVKRVWNIDDCMGEERKERKGVYITFFTLKGIYTFSQF